MTFSAVSTRLNLLAGLCAAVLAITGCDSGSDTKKETDGGSDAGGGNGAPNGNANDNGNGSSNMDGGTAPVADLEDDVAGKPCSADSDCKGDNATCATMIGGIAGFGGTAAPEGYCTGACNDDSNCGKGGVCSNPIPMTPLTPAMPGQCQASCDTDADCVDGQICNDPAAGAPEGGINIPGDAGIPGGFPGGGGMMVQKTCLPKPVTMQLGDGVAGKACAADADCGEGTCAQDEIGAIMTPLGNFGGSPVVGGYCTAACTDDSQCGAGGFCRTSPLGGAGTCFQACETQADCTRPEYTCSAGGFGGGMGGGGMPGAQSVCIAGDDPAPDAGVTDAGAGDAG